MTATYIWLDISSVLIWTNHNIVLNVKVFRNHISHRLIDVLCVMRIITDSDNIYAAAASSSIYIYDVIRMQTLVHHPWFKSSMPARYMSSTVMRWLATWQSCVSVMCMSKSWGAMCIWWWAAPISYLFVFISFDCCGPCMRALDCIISYDSIHIAADYRFEPITVCIV